MFTPIAKVSVANKHFIKPSENKISTVSFNRGNSPPWCTPIPRFRMFTIDLTCGSSRSSSLKQSVAFSKTSSTSFFSCSSLKSSRASCIAFSSHSRFEKQKLMTGWKLFSMIILMSLKMEESSDFPSFLPRRLCWLPPSRERKLVKKGVSLRRISVILTEIK